jgi:alpha-D-ribose 1-methylphosphonate 5-triphosphate synthase subunit PhnH
MTCASVSGFPNPGLNSQRVFRAAMSALASPALALPLPCPPDVKPPPGLSVEVACLLLALTDLETPVWLDPVAEGVGSYLSFHTGARRAATSRDASFAVITNFSALPSLESFAQGTHDYPDRSATLIIQARGLADFGWTCRGPGIDGSRRFSASPLPGDFLAQWAANTARFPLGIDILFVAGHRIAGLPRTTRLVEA